MYSDADAAALYDVMNVWNPAKYRSDAFYSDQVMAAESVLDLGCGTGSMLHLARESGHAGRLAGLDPDPAMLARAQRRGDIEWALAKAEGAAWDGEFHLATMTSHAFQFIVTDSELRASLAAIHAALVPGGRFTFETRQPSARIWDSWKAADAEEFVDHNGTQVRIWHEIPAEDGEVITVSELTDDRSGVRVDTCQMRFLSADRLNAFLTGAGFVVDSQHGDYSGGPVTESTSLVTIAHRR